MSTSDPSTPIPMVDDGPIWRVWLSAFHAPCMVLADELGIYRELRDGGATAAEVAQRLSIELRAVDSILSLLCSLGLLTHANGRFHLTDVARHCLLPESPYYWGAFLKRIHDTPINVAALAASLRAGSAGADSRVAGRWESGSPPPDFLRAFTRAMHAHSFSIAMRVAPALDLSQASRVLDAGGGSGSFSIAMATHHPSVRCTILDFPIVCEVASEYIAAAGVADRVGTAAGDLFAGPWPDGHDRVFFNDIYHDWDDERCAVMSRLALDALPQGGRIMVHEMLLADAKDGPLAAAAYSMAMVFATRGRQRSAPELVGLLEAAGFADVRVAPTTGGYALIEGRKA